MDSAPSETQDRGVSELLGLVLLFGMVAVGIAAILLAGSVAVDSIQEEASVSSAQMGMHELDSRVGDTTGGPVGIDLESRDGVYRVVRNGSVSFTVNGQANCSTTTPLGSVQYHDRRGNRLAYEAGGIWRLDSDGGISMVSAPQIDHDDGQLTMDLTNISGEFDGGQAVMRSAETSADDDIVEELYRGGDGCFPPETITITVESQFYEAWGRYFEGTLNESTTVVDDDARTASVELPIDSTFSVNSSNDSVTSSTQFNATVELLGTELSGLSGDRAIYGPTTFRVVAGGDEYTPWPDGDPDDAIADDPAEDDVNDPTEGEYQHYELNDYPAGTSITVRATSWSCGWWYDGEDTGQDITVGGDSYDQWRCTDLDEDDERISLNSTGESSNLVVLQDGEEVPSFGAAGPEQRGLDEILGSRIDDTGTLQLAPNEVVFLYELSEPDADPEDADGSGDPDYNDAVVLVTIEQSWNSTSDFSIRIEKDQIIVEEDDEENSVVASLSPSA